MMILPLWFPVCLMISVHGIVRGAYDKELVYEENDGSQVRSHLTNFRRSSSVLRITNAAIKALMKGAIEVPTNSKTYRKFMKQGTEKEAVIDFKATNPTDVRKRTFSIDGFVDGTILTLKTKDKSQGRHPSILITDSKLDSPIKIVYYETF